MQSILIKLDSRKGGTVKLLPIYLILYIHRSERRNEPMGNQKKEQGKKCFIITPIGDINSKIFREVKGIIDTKAYIKKIWV